MEREKFLCNDEMTSGGDRKEFREAFNETEEEGWERSHKENHFWHTFSIQGWRKTIVFSPSLGGATRNFQVHSGSASPFPVMPTERIVILVDGSKMYHYLRSEERRV